MSAYYNEIEPFAAAWLRELIKEKLIADGEVDERSIEAVTADDVRGFTQCHWFAGIGGWSYALRLAGWPDERAVWTGSEPCQPWSVAGKGEGADDSRDLWKPWCELIIERRPSTLFGEQVASSDGMFFLDRVFVDLEAAGYAVAAADLCAAGVSAPHLRQRLYFVADANGERFRGEGRAEDVGAAGAVQGQARQRQRVRADVGATGGSIGLANGNGYHKQWWSGPLQVGRNAIEATIERGGRQYRAQWRIKPGIPLLAHGVSRRVAKLCGLGNAIVPQVAQAFIEAYLECER